ncbi:hypothetical protein ACJX0J_021862 [Zea mays]
MFKEKYKKMSLDSIGWVGLLDVLQWHGLLKNFIQINILLKKQQETFSVCITQQKECIHLHEIRLLPYAGDERIKDQDINKKRRLVCAYNFYSAIGIGEIPSTSIFDIIIYNRLNEYLFFENILFDKIILTKALED